MTTGVLGGAFDPPHAGHVALAREAVRHFGLERLVIVVTGRPPHKDVPTDAELRFRLAEAAFQDVPGAELSRHELDRPGRSYTVDTARWAEREWGEEVVFLVGGDEFADFLGWKDPDEILDHVRLGVATRPGYPPERLGPVLAGLRRPERVELFEIPPVLASSSEIRARLERGEPAGDLLPAAVARRVVELDLYHEGS